MAYADVGDVRRAIELYEQALRIACRIGDRQEEAISSWNLGLLLEQQGELDGLSNLWKFASTSCARSAIRTPRSLPLSSSRSGSV